MVNMLLITKVHYMVDVVGGIVFAVFAYRTFIRFVQYVDKILSLPFVWGKMLYEKCRKRSDRANDHKDEANDCKDEANERKDEENEANDCNDDIPGQRISLSRSDSLNKSDRESRPNS